MVIVQRETSSSVGSVSKRYRVGIGVVRSPRRSDEDRLIGFAGIDQMPPVVDRGNG